eukprot:scaffold7354_cov59-Phaeocystis_antarctica.AAC.2
MKGSGSANGNEARYPDQRELRPRHCSCAIARMSAADSGRPASSSAPSALELLAVNTDSTACLGSVRSMVPSSTDRLATTQAPRWPSGLGRSSTESHFAPERSIQDRKAESLLGSMLRDVMLVDCHAHDRSTTPGTAVSLARVVLAWEMTANRHPACRRGDKYMAGRWHPPFYRS